MTRHIRIQNDSDVTETLLRGVNGVDVTEEIAELRVEIEMANKTIDRQEAMLVRANEEIRKLEGKHDFRRSGAAGGASGKGKGKGMRRKRKAER